MRKWKISEKCKATYFVEIESDEGMIAVFTDSPKKTEKAARLISAAPSMSVLLELLALGKARIEKSKTTDLCEFCFQGLRYSCTERDWAILTGIIGIDKIEATLKE
jgi:hypothetical protein